jgi:pyruvate dehydrogenase E1 component alpha subunit
MVESIAPKKSSKKPAAPATKAAAYSKETYLLWYETMLRSRRFEERTLLLYSQQKIRGFCHVYIGQEAICAGIASAMRQTDPLITAYRQHGPALAKGLNSKECLAELCGRVGGNVKGKGGSMHFFSKEHCFFGGHGIVGAQIPLGAGLAFAEKYKGTDNVTVCMFGDGAARQGALYEAFNMAMTWKLPVVFVCENNLYAMGTSVERTSNVTDIYKVGSAFEMPSFQVDGMSPEAVHEAFEESFARAKRGDGPTFLEIKTYRYKGHSVSDPEKYRKNNPEGKAEIEHYKNIDPLKMLHTRLLEDGLLTAAEIEAINIRIEAEIEEATEFAENSPFPPVSELYTDNYMQKDYPFIMD